MTNERRCGLCKSVLALLLFFAAGCAVQPVADSKVTLDTERDMQPVRQALLHGDWLVARGVHVPDNLVASLTNMPLSHAAIYDAQAKGVIEADGSGVHRASLEEFLAKSQRVLVIRPIWSSPENSAMAVERARSWLGKAYNYTGLVGLDTTDRYYCTQVALRAYEPFMKQRPYNPIPKIIKPGQMYHWGRIIYDSGPRETLEAARLDFDATAGPLAAEPLTAGSLSGQASSGGRAGPGNSGAASSAGDLDSMDD